MIPLLIGDADPPPFLRDKVAVRLPVATANYDTIAHDIVHFINHPAETVDSSSRARASVEQQSRLQDLERFAEALESSGLEKPDSEKSSTGQQ